MDAGRRIPVLPFTSVGERERRLAKVGSGALVIGIDTVVLEYEPVWCRTKADVEEVVLVLLSSEAANVIPLN